MQYEFLKCCLLNDIILKRQMTSEHYIIRTMTWFNDINIFNGQKKVKNYIGVSKCVLWLNVRRNSVCSLLQCHGAI